MTLKVSKLACLALLASAAAHGTLAQDAPAPPAPPATTDQPQQATPPSQPAAPPATTPQPPADSAPATTTRRASVKDPEFDMEGFSVQIPADWIFDGTFVPSPLCGTTQSMAIRMESPDGFTAARVLPALHWSYSESAGSRPPAEGCPMFAGTKSASDLLKSAIQLLNVEYVSDVANDLEDAQKTMTAGDNDKMHTTVDKARAKVKFKVNSIEMDGRVSVLVVCRKFVSLPFTTCSASISRSWAPLGQYDDEKFDAIQKTLVANQDYLAARMARQERELHEPEQQRAITDPVDRQHDPKRTARYEAQLMFTRQRDDLFPNSGAESKPFDPEAHPHSMIQRKPAPDRVVDDWADYAIEITPRLWNTDDATPPAPREYVWKNAAGETLITKSINDNPNGKGTGDWKLQPAK